MNPHHHGDWWKITVAWVIAAFETITHNSATVMFWLGAIYTLLNIVALIRREFLKKDNHASE